VRMVPKQMGDAYNWSQVAASSLTHSLLLKNDGSLWNTGTNESGQLGNGDTVSTKALTQIIQPGCAPSAASAWSSPEPITCYPNPVADQVFFSLHLDAEISLLNMQGQILLRQQAMQGPVALSVQHLLPSIYFLHVRDSEGTQVIRFLKKD